MRKHLNMKKYLAFGTLVIAMSGTAMAQEGGYLWENKPQQKIENSVDAFPVTNRSNAPKIGHTAVQHKRYLFDDEPNSLVLQESMNSTPRHGNPDHNEHFASDHKRNEVGS